MTIKRLFAIAFIFACTTAAWVFLGATLSARSNIANARFSEEVSGNWGSILCQTHPTISYASPTCEGGQKSIAPDSSRLQVTLDYEPRRKGLLRHRTYGAHFEGRYTVRNPLPIRQTFYARFELPEAGGLDGFALAIDEKATDKVPLEGVLTEAIDLAPGQTSELLVSYAGKGRDRWIYTFGETPRVRNFSLQLATNFTDYDFPTGTRSANLPVEQNDDGLAITWRYEDIIGAGDIGMSMPKVLNPGPIAQRITFFAPVSLLFFFAVLLIVASVRGVELHPMHFFFLAAACFAFQLLFAYLVDHVGMGTAFAIAAAVSLLLVGGYLRAVADLAFAKISLLAQFAYMVLFSGSFFFDGMTGITITIGAVATLALLMGFTAKTDWGRIFRKRTKKQVEATTPPPLPEAPAEA